MVRSGDAHSYIGTGSSRGTSSAIKKHCLSNPFSGPAPKSEVRRTFCTECAFECHVRCLAEAAIDAAHEYNLKVTELKSSAWPVYVEEYNIEDECFGEAEIWDHFEEVWKDLLEDVDLDEVFQDFFYDVDIMLSDLGSSLMDAFDHDPGDAISVDDLRDAIKSMEFDGLTIGDVKDVMKHHAKPPTYKDLQKCRFANIKAHESMTGHDRNRYTD